MGEKLTAFVAMDGVQRKHARRTQVQRDLHDLQGRVGAWLSQWKARDQEQFGRYHSQLKTIEALFGQVFHEFAGHLERLSTEASSGQLYDECRKLAEGVVWLERMWEFIRLKLDQRLGDTPVAQLLRAADEVVWSCYRPVIRNLPPGHPAIQRATPPLTYLEPEYSPAAAQFDRPLPPSLRFTSTDPRLNSCVQNIPIATLRLTPWCVSAPWWLVLIGHEVGHHIQHELELVGTFAEGVSSAATAAGVAESTTRYWSAWSEEIFADACFLVTIGPSAIRAITELEWTVPASLCRRKPNYPAPVIRIALLTRLAIRLGMDSSTALPLKELEDMALSTPATKEDWSVIEGVIDLIERPIGNLPKSLEALFGCARAEFAPRGRVAVWAQGLCGISTVTPKKATIDARHMASAAFYAWGQLLSEPEATCSDGLRRLESLVPQAVLDCAEQCTRAGPSTTASVTATSARRITAALFGEPSSDGFH